MKNLVVIKSYQNGISLHMDKEADFSEILSELAEKFRASKTFFKDIKVALSIEERVLTDDEEKQVIQTITLHSDVRVLCIVGKDEEKNCNFVKALKRVEHEKEETNGRFHKGTLREGQVLETEGSIVIIGDVKKGASVIAAKDIVIIGGLYGEAYAGANKEEGHFITALYMDPQKCRIADVRYYPKEKSIWSRKPKYMPQIAQIKNGEIIVSTITKELPEQ